MKNNKPRKVSTRQKRIMILTLLSLGNLAWDAPTMLSENDTAVAGAVSIASDNGIITTEALTTAAGASYTLTITFAAGVGVTANSNVSFTRCGGTSTAGIPVIINSVCTTNQCVLTVTNVHAANALNGTLKLKYEVQQPIS